MSNSATKRQQAKTPEQRFLQVLETDFGQAPRVSEAILEEAQACLYGQASALRPGQVRVLLSALEAGPGRTLRETKLKEVVWTVDAGQEDLRVQQAHGSAGLRRTRIQRLADEAVAQGGVATQEDLARVLNVSTRTIKRDSKALEAAGIYLPTRGRLKGIGRGQTHKAQIVGRWLRGETYDQIQLHTRHSLVSIKRYVHSFVRVVDLHQQGMPESQIAFALQISEYLVGEYLALYGQHDTVEYRARLTEQIERLRRAPGEKKGVL
jgi:DNA-binding MarR family transcriptional regulator